MSFPKSFSSAPAGVKNQADPYKLTITGVHCAQSISFLAFLTSFNQSFTSTWNTEVVYGRADPIATFQGNQRNIDLAWEVPAGNLAEAKENLKRFEGLFQIIYPSYQSNELAGHSTNALSISKPPLTRIKYANLLQHNANKGQLGYITNIAWQQKINMGTFQEGSKIYPKVISINISFVALHERDLGWNLTKWKGGKSFPFGG